MKKNVMTIAACLLIGQTALMAQARRMPPKAHKQMMVKMEAKKVAFISKRANLTPQDSTKIWPVYNQYQADLRKLNLRKSEMELRKASRDTAISGSKITQITENFIKNKQEAARLGLGFYTQAKTILSPKKLAKFYVAQQNFRRVMKKRMEQHRMKVSPQRASHTYQK